MERPFILEFDLNSVPWSRYGSYMAISTLVKGRPDPWDCDRDRVIEPGIYLHDVSGSRFWKWNGVFRLTCLDESKTEPLTVHRATPSLLELGMGSGAVELTWDGPDTLRLRGHGMGLRLTQSLSERLGSALAFPRSSRSWRLHMGGDAHYVATCLKGVMSVEAPISRTSSENIPDRKVVEIRPDNDGCFEFVLTQYQSGFKDPDSYRNFEDCVADVDRDFASWLSARTWRHDYLVGTWRLASYITWSCMVGVRGLLGRPAMLMSKNWMHAVWSWDHCFNALGLAGSHPDLAWDQFMLPFDLQTGQGTLPDLFHDNGWLLGFVKPPIHGWALSKLIAAGLVTDTRLEEIYPKLVSWTRWWLHYRDDDGDGLCEYFHGCDSGQDNATVFDSGFPAVGPDLAAYLIIQMDVLADIAGRLEMTDEATLWQGHADKMLALLLGRLWDGQRFRVERTGDQAWNPESHSLVVFLPMILGDRLPADVRMKLVMDFRGSGLLTDYGPATESPDSRLFERDGYWRGPIWAPTTLLIVDGLNACGERELAEEVASRFIGICQVSGFAENFDAMTGQSLRDPAYSWTASTFLVLAAEYLQLGKIFNKS